MHQADDWVSKSIIATGSSSLVRGRFRCDCWLETMIVFLPSQETSLMIQQRFATLYDIIEIMAERITTYNLHNDN